MSYIIRKTNGTTLGTILDGTVDTAQTSLTLVGRNYSNYGQIMTDNLVKLVENFAYSNPPSHVLAGQLWWDSGHSLLKVYTGSTFKIVGSATAQNSSTDGAPSTTIAGDIWWDTYANQLYVYDGSDPFVASGWQLVGPIYSKVHGKSGAVWEQLSDGSSWYDVVSMYLDGTRTAIISTNSFTSNVTVAGITAIKVGYNLAAGHTLWGTANNASYLGDQPAANFWRNNQNNTGTGTLSVVNNSGVTIGSAGQLTLSTSGSDATIVNNSLNGDILFKVDVSSISTTALTIDGATGLVTVADDPVGSMGIATKQYVDNSFVDATLTGVSTAITAPALTANTMIATTEFVINNAGFYPNKIYQGNSVLEITDAGTGNIALAIDNTTVLTATVSGVDLKSGVTTATQTQDYNTSGNARVATTQFVKTATQWWDGSAKFVSTDAPDPGVNDIGSNDGDFWFQYTV